MAYRYLDRSGWMKTIEDVPEQDPDTRRKALRVLLGSSETYEEGCQFAKMLGLLD